VEKRLKTTGLVDVTISGTDDVLLSATDLPLNVNCDPIFDETF